MGKKGLFLLLHRAFSIWKKKTVRLPFSVQMADTLFTIPQSCFSSVRLIAKDWNQIVYDCYSLHPWEEITLLLFYGTVLSSSSLSALSH